MAIRDERKSLDLTKNPVESLDGSTIYAYAKFDHADRKAAIDAGEPIPATPFHDELVRRNEVRNSTKAQKKTGGGGTKKTAADIRYLHDGKPMSDAQNKLSSVAWFHTRGIDPKHDRLGVAELVAILAKLGVSDPRSPGWMAKLSNGVTLEARKNGEASQFKGEPAKRTTSTTKKATTKKATAKKSTPTKRTPAKATNATKKTPGQKAREAKATTTRMVTPLPKKSAAKSTAKKSNAAARTTRRTSKTSPGPKSLTSLLKIKA